MADVTVTEETAGRYLVVIRDGSTSTTHRVTVPVDLPATLGCAQVAVVDLVRCSFTFLLGRESPASILRQFSLELIGHYFPEYPHEIRRMVLARDDIGGA